MEKIYIESLGCPKNLVDSELILHILKTKKYSITAHFQDADIIVINTCGFIKKAKEESIQYILYYSKLKKKKIIVTGCLVNLYKKELLKNIPEIKYVYSVNEFFNKYLQCEYDKFLDYSHFHRLTPCSYTYIKISDGCNKDCSFCVIPLIKGKQFSRPVDNIIKEIKQKVDYGFKEFNLVAQDLCRFGIDNEDTLFILLDRIEKLNYDFKIRLLYLYPEAMIIDLAKRISQSEKLINYLDIPFQHSSEKLLKLMNRPFKASFYYDLFDKIKKYGNFILRSTFIIGFPGETKEDFKHLKKFLQEIKFNWAGFYAYSDEENACSFQLENKVDEDTVKNRLDEVIDLQKTITSEWLHTRVNKCYDVLVDEIVPSDDYILTRSEEEAPDIDGNIIVKYNKRIQCGDRLRVRIKQSFDYDMEGEVNG